MHLPFSLLTHVQGVRLRSWMVLWPCFCWCPIHRVPLGHGSELTCSGQSQECSHLLARCSRSSVASLVVCFAAVSRSRGVLAEVMRGVHGPTASFLTPIPVVWPQICLLVAQIVINLFNWGQTVQSHEPFPPLCHCSSMGQGPHMHCLGVDSIEDESEDGQRGLILCPASHQQIVSAALP